MSLNLEQHFASDSYLRPSLPSFGQISSITSPALVNHKRNCSQSTSSIVMDGCTSFNAEDMEPTEKDVANFEYTEDVLLGRKSIRRNHERDLFQLKRNMENVMHSKFPFEIKVKLMESISEMIKTKIELIKDSNQSIRENIVSVERASGYKASVRIVKGWAIGMLEDQTKANEDLTKNVKDSLTFTTTPEETPKKRGFMEDNPEMTEYQKELDKQNYELERSVITLKQARIPILIALENLKEDYSEVQEQISNEKKILEGILMSIENRKKRIAKTGDIWGANKENIDPKEAKKKGKNKIKELYEGYEERTHEMSMSRINTSTSSNNLSRFKEASSKVSKMFSSLFSKKQKAPENILTTEVMEELGLQAPSTKRQ